MVKKLKYIFILISLLFCFIFISISSYAHTLSENLSANFFRLHILANSNSEIDQDLKLKVRDSLLKYMNTICSNCYTKEEAIVIAQNHKFQFQIKLVI